MQILTKKERIELDELFLSAIKRRKNSKLKEVIKKLSKNNINSKNKTIKNSI